MHEEYVVSFVQRLMILPSNIGEKHSNFNKYSHIHIQNTDICGDSLLGNTLASLEVVVHAIILMDGFAT